ncbi:hypothetical protein BDZ90DRAFT_36757 [Jaminaea rosea]|uniref:Uncharacterized protein n=1 Tax=Jaminaea rosea TaxID=1569628 RepID=A0A316V0R6_9BASI|nr:hypothetical protein BDZ90DRAFT_36757 [Jaminaea rosea]PWN31139.1 hypothetical protein BDZ90DRAFT_36757 [Jaminaea rosea]
MLSNPFRRKARQPSKPGGIRIGLAQRNQQMKEQQQQQQRHENDNAASTSSSSSGALLSLPPESDYRTSLIMPHLTRRFTLLRAPDGTMVTPDAMRAQLRAQRARARATGQPGGNFLTEQEEDEIIDQMRQQTLFAQANGQDGDTNRDRFTVGSGSDGFGASYASSTGERSSAADRIGSLTESLGELKNVSSFPSSGSGSLFSGRSSERDNAYLRSLDKSKVASMASPIEEEEEEEEQQEEQQEEDEGTQEEEVELQYPEEERAVQDDVAVPGGFGDAQSQVAAQRSGAHLAPPTLQQPQRQSQLLSALSPEAFRRVSTALEEVIGIVSPGSLPRFGGAPGDDGDYEIDAISAEESDEEDGEDGGEDEMEDEEQSRGHSLAGENLFAEGMATRSNRGDEADDEVSDESHLLRGLTSRGKEASDSDGESFRSAKEETATSVAIHEDVQRTPQLEQTPRPEVMTTPRVQGAANSAPRRPVQPSSAGNASLAASTPPSSSSGTSASVISAGNIAARSQRYFPSAGGGIKTTLPLEYASGFRNSPSTPAGSTSDRAPLVNDGSLAAASSALAATTNTPSQGFSSIVRRQPPPANVDTQRAINASQEDVLSPTTGGLFPQPPTHDPILAQRWRQTYGQPSLASPSDVGSIGGGSESNISDFERQFEQEPEVDDVWAKVARNMGTEEGDAAASGSRGLGAGQTSSLVPTMDEYRPVSHMPPAEAASQFNGDTVNQLAEIQANLVRSVSQRHGMGPIGPIAPPIPLPASHPNAIPPPMSPERPAQTATVQPLSPERPAQSALVQPLSPVSPVKLEKARERARQIAAERVRGGSISGSTPSSPSRGPTAQVTSSEDSAWPASQSARMSHSNSQRSFKGREVMYDVTSSHRPTSPPPGRTSGGLPTIQDLNILNGIQPDSVSYSMSLEQALDKAANFESFSDGHSRAAGGSTSHDYGGLFAPAIEEDDAEGGYDDESYPSMQQGHPYASAGGNANASAAANMSSPHSAQSVWSDSRSPRQGQGFTPNLVDDVAAQAQAATAALKGPHSGDGGPHLLPRRSRILSKRKAKRNPGKFIGAPELLTTSQYMGHAQPIPEPTVNKKSPRSQTADAATQRRPPFRQASDYRNDPKTMPATLLHMRRSSSFGHRGRLDTPSSRAEEWSSPTSAAPASTAAAWTPPASRTLREPPASAPASAPAPAGNLVAPGTPASIKSSGGGSAAGTLPASSSNGSLSRLMSRMRVRKPTEEGSPSVTQQSPSLSAADHSATGSAMLPDRGTPMRGPSPFGIGESAGPAGRGAGGAGGLSTDSTLPESGAAGRLTGMMPSPIVDRSETSALGHWSGPSAPLANEDSWRTSSTADHSLAANESGGSKGLLGSPAAIQEDNFGGFAPAWKQPQQQQAQLQASSAPQNRVSTATSGSLPTSDPPANGSIAPAVASSSARNTIIRRTLIFPNEAAANEEQRRRLSVASSVAPSVASRRKSRPNKAGEFDDDEANASYAALIAGGSGAGNEASRPSSQIRRSEDNAGGANRATMRMSRASKFGAASLRPPSFANSTRRVSTATGGADGGSYAGSLYDMYIGPSGAAGDEDRDGASLYDGSRPGSSAFNHAQVPTGSHIEVTERADGSVVWQIIAGLGKGEGERRSGEEGATAAAPPGGHTRGNSDASQFSFLNRPPRDSYADASNGSLLPQATGHSTYQQQGRPSVEEGGRTFTGLLRDGEDDSRSLFQRQRTESNVAAAMRQRKQGYKGGEEGMPDLPLAPWQAAQQQGDEAQPRLSSEDARLAAAQSAFNLRLADQALDTRVVYTNDVELEQLLESLARQHEDGGKFLFDPKQYYAVKRRLLEEGGGTVGGEGAEQPGAQLRTSDVGAGMRPISRAYREEEDDPTGQQGRDSFLSPSSPDGSGLNSKSTSATTSLLRQSDAGRRRVEDEIMNLLGQSGHAERGSAVPSTNTSASARSTVPSPSLAGGQATTRGSADGVWAGVQS